MSTLFPLNKIMLISAFLICVFIADKQIAVADIYYGPQNNPPNQYQNYNQPNQYQYQNQYQNYNQPYQYQNQNYSQPVQYAAPVVYPQYYGAPSNAQAFPNSAEFNNTYERNAHPPR